jgi:hypothetical protein
MSNPINTHLENSTNLSNNTPITKDMLLELALQVHKESKEFLEVGKQFCEFIKSR